jgi:hypothetical protein
MGRAQKEVLLTTISLGEEPEMKKYSNRILFTIAAISLLTFFLQAASAADTTYKVTFSTGTTTVQTAAVNAGEDFVFAIVCQPPTDIKEMKASNGTLTAGKTTLGGPSTPQGVINGIWTLSKITGDVTITLNLNTKEGAALPKITTGKKEAEAAISSSGGMGGGMGAPPSGGAPGGAPPAGAPTGAPPNSQR